MITKRCIYVDDDKQVQSGIFCSEDNGDNFIICDCCGSIVDPTEVKYRTIENWVDRASDDINYLKEKTEEQLAELRRIEELTRLYLEKYGQLEIVLPYYQRAMVTNAGYVEFNPIWD